MELKNRKITETQYKIPMPLDQNFLKSINLFPPKRSFKYNVLTSSKKLYRTPYTMPLEDFQFR